MEKYTLSASLRSELGKKNEAVRNNFMVPAVVYGHGVTNQNIVVSAADFRNVFAKAEHSGLIDLTVDGSSPVAVLVQDLQRNPLTHDVTHVDFYQVRMDEKLTATVTLEFVGESRTEKELGGNVVRTHDSVEIECLPKDLVQNLEVDLSLLKEFGDALRYSDIKVPAGVKILGDEDTVVASAQAPQEIEEDTAAPVVDVNAVEVEKKGKKDEEESK